MEILKRQEGQWVEVTHRSGDVLRIRVCKIEGGLPGHLNLAFDDDARNFEIERPERRGEPRDRSGDDARGDALTRPERRNELITHLSLALVAASGFIPPPSGERFTKDEVEASLAYEAFRVEVKEAHRLLKELSSDA